MKLTLALILAFAMQMGGISSPPQANQDNLRFQRSIVPAGAGNVCAILDGDVFAHAATGSAADLRLFTSGGVETPFELTESSPAAAPTEAAQVLNAGVAGDAVVFDLRMPKRAYSEVDLDLDAKDFVAVAEVTAQSGAESVQLGTFTLFALEAQHLSRSTALPLQEATWPVLHVSLRFHDAKGKPLALPAAVVRGAAVPPSREAQTLYTTIASTNTIVQKGRATTATLHVLAHVPVERANIVLDSAFTQNFVRTMSVESRDGEADSPDHVAGEIIRAHITPENLPQAPPIRVEHLGIDAVLAANLHDAADVTVTIENGDDHALPVRAVELAMRQRKICFTAAAGVQYTARYGDAALAPPHYDFARLYDASAPAATVALGPEVQNPKWTPRADSRPFTERHPEFLWIALFAAVAILGATALASVRRQQGGS